MQVGSSGIHLLDEDILQKSVDIQRAWMRTVIVEERKGWIRQKMMNIVILEMEDRKSLYSNFSRM